MHPVLSADFAVPSFRLFLDGDAVRLVGELDSFCADQLRRVLTSALRLTAGVIDLSGVDFIDHRSLLTLNDVATGGSPVRLRAATRTVRRVWDLLDVAQPRLEFV